MAETGISPVRVPNPAGATRATRAGLPLPALAAWYALARAGFRRYSTYRQATLAGLFTNVVFGYLRCSVLLSASGHGGTVAGYARAQLVTYVFIGQGMIATVMLWGDTELAERITTGNVVADLLRPVHPVWGYLAADLGRAGYAALTRFAVPVLVGMASFPFYLPRRASTYPLLVLSVLLATVVSFACRYLVNASAYWLMDARGPQLAWTLAANVLGGLYFPLWFLPARLVVGIWVLTPFPSLLQASLDVAAERWSAPVSLAVVGGQAAWAVAMLAACAGVQRLAERKLVVQGG